MSRRRSALLLLLLLLLPGLLAGCSSTPHRSAADAGAPPADSIVVAAAGGGSLGLYRISARHAATRLRALRAPAAGAEVAGVSLSAGPDPVVCASWQRPHGSDTPDRLGLRCYAPGDDTGVSIGGPGPVPATWVSLRSDGRALAWVESPGDGAHDTIRVAQLVDGTFRPRETIVGDPAKSGPGGYLLEGPSGLAWVGKDALAVTIDGQDDEGPGMVLLPLSPIGEARGWANAPVVPVPDQDTGMRQYDGVMSATSTQALAVERPSYNGAPPSVSARGVRVDLATGRVLEVLARALKGRDVVSISGRAEALVYETTANSSSAGGTRFYARLAGDAVGQRVTGLPADTTMVVAPG